MMILINFNVKVIFYKFKFKCIWVSKIYLRREYPKKKSVVFLLRCTKFKTQIQKYCELCGKSNASPIMHMCVKTHYTRIHKNNAVTQPEV